LGCALYTCKDFVWFSFALCLRTGNLKPPLPTFTQRGRPGQEGRRTHTVTTGKMTGECSGGKDQRDHGLDIENNRHTPPRGALFPVPRIRPPKSPETTPVCRFTVAADNTAASCWRHQFSHASLSKSMRNLIPTIKTGWRHLKVPSVLYTCTSILTLTRRQKSTCALYTSVHYTRDFTVSSLNDPKKYKEHRLQ